ncbi:hypothetical protein PM082_006506 [Marasmius tenuissimus]|nr:hypothetical protein PM082_006506 [Marasmius tenuissimus]
MSKIKVDDSDKTILSYSEDTKWEKSRRADPNEYKTTSHGSFFVGATVSLRFNGTTVEVKGTVLKDNRNKTSLAIFTLDDDGQNMFTFDRSPSKDTLYNHTLYSNMSLRADKEHTLNMLLNDEDKRLWLDYIEYTPTSSATDPPPESSATSDILPGSTNEPQNSVDHEGISTGLVVGVSVAAVILTVLVVIGLWWLRRRDRIKQASEEPAASFMHPSGPNTVAPMVQRGFRHGHVQPYPSTMIPSGGPRRPQIQYIPSQYSSATSASGTDQEQPQDIESELPPYRKRA